MTVQSPSELGPDFRGMRQGRDRPVICVQGLGYVGFAMAVAVASARDEAGSPRFNVIGIDLKTPRGLERVRAMNEGHLPFQANDPKFKDALREAQRIGNVSATTDPQAYSLAAVAVVDVALDVVESEKGPTVAFGDFRSAIRTLGEYMNPGSLVVVETTVPPGTCEKIVVPELAAAMRKRGLSADSLLVAHSCERVTPGSGYLDSIIAFWRVYAGHTAEAASACEEFLTKVINTKAYPLTRLSSTTASETVKILENSYRATTIAFMEEWGRFAEAIGIDLFEVVRAVRQRPTHANIRQPGFGVGGYCLTKDPLFASIGAREFFQLDHLEFPFCRQAVSINANMPLVSFGKLESLLGGSLAGKKILLFGVSYRRDIGDTRHSPSERFVLKAHECGASVTCHDPLIQFWPELNLPLTAELPTADGMDAVVFAVPHADYATLDVKKWLNGAKPCVLDAHNVLSDTQRADFKSQGCRILSIGRGEES